jgi:hypothetical protein
LQICFWVFLHKWQILFEIFVGWMRIPEVWTPDKQEFTAALYNTY